jgi:Putative Flp pilus-assembly TadE/G-like
MKHRKDSLIARSLRDERGQILPWMVLLSGLVIGVAGITIDLGHAYICYRQLQMSTDAAALAGAYAMGEPGATSTTATNEVNLFASTAGGANATPNLPSPTISTSFKCITDSVMVAAPCAASGTGNNVIVVTQHATIPTYFIKMLAIFRVNAATSLTLSSTSTATMASGSNDQVNVAMVLDTTASMATADSDASCGHTRIYCALQGVQTMMKLLAPCSASTSKSGVTCVPYDQVGLFTFPPFQANTAKNDNTCPSSNPTITPYFAPTQGGTWSAPTGTNPTYQISDYVSNWSSNNAVGGSLNTSSALTIATGGSTCNGVQTPGGDGTYYAAAIIAAQSSLMAEKAANPTSRNVMIILSDGDASASASKITGSSGKSGSTYGAATNQCQQAINASTFAQGQGTTVYTIAYGAPSSGCSTDSPSISPCATLQKMSSGYLSSSNAPNFYSDATASQNKGQCTSPSNPNLTLNGIFGSITAQLTKARLLPNNIS